MKPAITLSRRDNLPELKARLRELARTEVLVGVPESNTTRKKGDVTNAELLYIHSKGSPLQHIPARPLVEPAITAPTNRDIIADKLRDAGASILDGKPAEARKGMKLTGMAAVSLIKSWFTDPRNNWAPNAPSTIKRKGSDRPLIDLGALRRAITYVLRKK